MLPLNIWLEKRPGHGEDANPLKLDYEKFGTVLAVFDGLGGAGAAKIEQPGEEATSEARLAARYLREKTKEYFDDLQSRNDLNHIETNLAEFLRNSLKSYNSTLPRVKSKLKSLLLKQLPSTGCILIHNKAVAESVLIALWAGDSRAYRVRTDGALECLTPDHVKHRSHQSKQDYFFSNGDAAMTNNISASHDFKIHRTDSQFFAKDTIVAFVCSDGAFSAFKDHLLFEQAVLKTLIGKMTSEEFVQYIDEHRSDDVSLQAIVIQEPDKHSAAIEKRLGLLERAIEDKDQDAKLSVVKQTFPFVSSSNENDLSNESAPPPADSAQEAPRLALATSALTQAEEAPALALASATTDTRQPKAPADLLNSWKDDLLPFNCYSDPFSQQQKARKVSNDLRVAPRTEFFTSPGRNDPCPCGSGKKYKKCCRS